MPGARVIFSTQIVRARDEPGREMGGGMLARLCKSAAAIGAVVLSLWAGAAAAAEPLQIVSSAAALVSGGDALMRIDASVASVRVDGRDVTSGFQADPRRPDTRLGLVSNLRLGTNRIEAFGADGKHVQSLTLANHPLTGPIVSGPHVTPFICQTQTFALPGGQTLGPALDADCTAPRDVRYVYMPTQGGAFLPLADPRQLPTDVKMTTTTDGATVPFVVRLETLTINRGIHQNAVLFDPRSDGEPTPWAPPRGWNHRLLAVHGAGCAGGWYIQGGVQGESVLDAERLGEGYAVFNNTLRHPTNSCNPLLAGETVSMDKEYFIEHFGPPDFTLSRGTSGGAYTSLQVADAFPGLFDGIVIGATFPDALSIALAGLDGHLLTHFFATHPGFTPEQVAAISGYKGPAALLDAANQAQRTDPTPGRADAPGYNSAVWNAVVPAALRYEARANPRGARPTVFDWNRNTYGIDPRTGIARRPFDNVGVQYGLSALRAGAITPDQFVDLNESIGGYDNDANYVPRRSVGDAGAIRRAQEMGVALGGGGGLAAIPVIDASSNSFRYDEDARYHYQWFHFAVRERMRGANGDVGNHVMWRGGVSLAAGASETPEAQHYSQVVTARAWDALVAWVSAARADTSDLSDREKTLRNRPADLVDGCWARETEPRFIPEPQTLSAQPDTACNRLFPSYSFARREAGGPLAANIYKCALRPLSAADYPAGMTDAQMQRLRRVFPQGVCDFTQAGSTFAPLTPQPMSPH